MHLELTTYILPSCSASSQRSTETNSNTKLIPVSSLLQSQLQVKCVWELWRNPGVNFSCDVSNWEFLIVPGTAPRPRRPICSFFFHTCILQTGGEGEAPPPATLIACTSHPILVNHEAKCIQQRGYEAQQAINNCKFFSQCLLWVLSTYNVVESVSFGGATILLVITCRMAEDEEWGMSHSA